MPALTGFEFPAETPVRSQFLLIARTIYLAHCPFSPIRPWSISTYKEKQQKNLFFVYSFSAIFSNSLKLEFWQERHCT